MAQPLIACENLVKIYKVPEAQVEVVALQGLELDVYQGEFLAIVGRSGSGKTTLMNVLGALDLPSAGACSVSGYRLTRLSEHEQDSYRRFVAGHVWQHGGRNLAPDLTIRQNVDLPQVLAGVSRRKRASRSQTLLTLVGLADKAERTPAQLSGGEQQRAAIAVALANDPVLLLADEPTGELDSGAAQEIVALLRRLTHEHGLTVVLVTHDPAVAAQADRTIAIRDGRTSTETVRRERPLDVPPEAAGALAAATATGLPEHTHREAAVLDRTGQLQLPEAAITGVDFAGRAELIIRADHVELWPVATAPVAPEYVSQAGALTGLPASTYHEAVVIDRVGRLQLSEEALDRVPFGRRALVRMRADHVELWPLGAAEA
jgi:ABC-type lipoprotein export system ATPase subunit